MKVTTERLPDCMVKLMIEIEPEHLDKPLRQTARKLARQVRVPGFRRGKAPFNVIVHRFGQEALLEDVIEREGQGWYEKALEEAELEPYGQAQVEITSYEPMVMTFTLPVAPVVDLGDYRTLRLDWEPPAVSDEDVEKELARLRQESAVMEPRERPAEMEDVVTLDIEGRIGDEVVVSAEERAITLNPDINYPYPVSGFAAKIVGLSCGKDHEFTLIYPQDHANPAWAGQEAHFKVHMHSIKVWVTPDLDDELAKTVGDFETLDEWRAGVREGLETSALDQAERDYADSVVDALADQAHIEFPVIAVERQLDGMVQEADQSLQQRGLGLKNYLVMIGQSQEEYRESMRETAERRVKRGLSLTELVEVEGLQVSGAEIDAKIDHMVESAGDDDAANFRKTLEREEIRESIRSSLLTQAVVDTLKAIARGEYVSQALYRPVQDSAAPGPEEGESELAPEAEPAETPQEAMEETVEEAEETIGEGSSSDETPDLS